jgi:hypothetical protein
MSAPICDIDAILDWNCPPYAEDAEPLIRTLYVAAVGNGGRLPAGGRWEVKASRWLSTYARFGGVVLGRRMWWALEGRDAR